MIIGTVPETKTDEHRVGITPDGARDLTAAGHTVLVERGAGAASRFDDAEYAAAGATLVDDPATVYADAAILCKVKEPQPPEFPLLRADQILFTYLHLAASAPVTDALIASGGTAIAYETVQKPDGTLPLLAPMSQIAGRMAIDVAAQFLRRPGPGRGVLLGGIPGVPPGHVVILGAGNVGRYACRAAVGMGARVTVVSRDAGPLAALDAEYGGRIETARSGPSAIAAAIRHADVVVGAIHVPGHRTPILVDRPMLRTMGEGAVAVDVAVDQGGCIETTRPTTHSDPIYVEEGVVHYGVANMPGAVPRTASRALAAATLPYLLLLANRGPNDALRTSEALRHGVNVHAGAITNPGVAAALGRSLGALPREWTGGS